MHYVQSAAFCVCATPCRVHMTQLTPLTICSSHPSFSNRRGLMVRSPPSRSRCRARFERRSRRRLRRRHPAAGGSSARLASSGRRPLRTMGRWASATYLRTTRCLFSLIYVLLCVGCLVVTTCCLVHATCCLVLATYSTCYLGTPWAPLGHYFLGTPCPSCLAHPCPVNQADTFETTILPILHPHQLRWCDPRCAQARGIGISMPLACH